MSTNNIDYVVIGIGHPSAEYQGTPYNAGYTFCDYLANCIAMQTVLLKTGMTDNKYGEIVIPPEFKRPVFIRNTELAGKVPKI